MISQEKKNQYLISINGKENEICGDGDAIESPV